MQWKNTLYRAVSYWRHYLTSWNTGGEGIHSPYLFYIVRMLMYDQHAYYCFVDIERRRAVMRSKQDTIRVEDFGTGGAHRGHVYTRTVGQIAKSSLESPRVGQLLFRLAAHLGHEAGRPLEIVELGTSLGITTAYLAAADSRNRVVTFEGCEAIAGIACKNWRRLGIENIELIEGNIDDTLHTYARTRVDLAYIDANHTEDATWRYFEYLLPMAGEKTIFVVDDIHHSRSMWRAWKKICAHPKVTTTMDLWHVGLVFFDPHYLRRNYTIRI